MVAIMAFNLWMHSASGACWLSGDAGLYRCHFLCVRLIIDLDGFSFCLGLAVWMPTGAGGAHVLWILIFKSLTGIKEAISKPADYEDIILNC